MNFLLPSSSCLLIVACASGLSNLVSAGTAASDWTDRKEYDLVLTIRSETTPQKRLDLLESWTKTYPKTQLSKARLELYLATYESLGDSMKMFDTAGQMLAIQPSDPVGLYWSTVLLPELQNPAREKIDVGVRSAQTMLSGIETYFGPERKPAAVTESDWRKQKGTVEVLAHRTIGWANWQNGDLPVAEQEFTTCLQKDPKNSEISAWLGIVLGLENGKQAPALWHLARASRLEEGGTLPEDQRRQVNTLLEHIYASYHGGNDGIDDLRTESKASAFPPSEFSIDSATTSAALRAEGELASSNPELAAWMSIRRQLDGPAGDQFFTSNLLSKPLPRLKGTVMRGARSAHEYVLSMSGQAGSSDVILTMKSSLVRSAGPGSKLAFRGVAESFTQTPFSLRVSANPADVEILSGR